MSTPSKLESAGSDLAPINFDQDYVWNKANMRWKRKNKPTNNSNRRKKNEQQKQKWCCLFAMPPANVYNTSVFENSLTH